MTRVEADLPSKKATTLRALQRALELAGVEFIDENGGGPGVRLRIWQNEPNRSDRR